MQLHEIRETRRLKMFYDFIILPNSNSPQIFNSVHVNKNEELSEYDLELIKEKFKYHNLYFIAEKSDYRNIWDDGDAYISIVRDDNIDSFISMNNVYLFVEDESKLFENIKKVYDRTTGWIDLRFRDFNTYDRDVLNEQLAKIEDFLFAMYEEGKLRLINQLTGFMNKVDKFDRFGYSAFFIAPDGNIYSHPMFYYNDNKQGIISNIADFNEDSEEINHYTKPSLVCQTCTCFYCDKNIYYNKIETSEFMAPAAEECGKNTLLSFYSKKLFNRIIGKLVFTPEENLDKGNEPIPFEVLYDDLVNDRIKINKVKRDKFNNLERW